MRNQNQILMSGKKDLSLQQENISGDTFNTAIPMNLQTPSKQQVGVKR